VPGKGRAAEHQADIVGIEIIGDAAPEQRDRAGIAVSGRDAGAAEFQHLP
jgi:hypothetical protein